MAKVKASLICTVLNEQASIERLIDSVALQSVIPDELIIVDGGSRDNTSKIISKKIKQYSRKIKIKLIVKKGNRSIGRNEGIGKAANNIILLTDAGCILDKDWVKYITAPFNKSSLDVVSGYYRGKCSNSFEKSVVPYALVMEDKVNPKEFLPATRSMAFRKDVWLKIGGFDEKLSHNEDYAFANKIKENKFKIFFQKKAIAYWLPRKTIQQAFKMFFRFALGDSQANIFRDKVVYIFLRYFFAAYLLMLTVIMKSLILNLFIFACLVVYVLWSIRKNYKYVKELPGFIYLPLLQFTSDAAVLTGTSLGLVQKLSLNNLVTLIKHNFGMSILIVIYGFLMLILIKWGVPNLSHPFNYAMDEWHFSQALRAFINHGTGLISGSANIPFYHIVSSIIFLIPFYLFSIVNPLAIKSSIDNLIMQQTLFEILRLHTLFYGILSIGMIYALFKKYLSSALLIFIGLFTFTPIWLLLTNYYKYDITLLFWIITAIYLLFKYHKSQNINHFIFAGIATALALSTKFTAFPLLISYLLSYVILTKNKQYKYLLISLIITLGVFIFVGIPDIVLGKGNYYELIASTLINGPKSSESFIIGYPSWFYLLFKQFPSIFGYFITFLYYLSIIYYSAIFIFSLIKKNFSNYKIELVVYISSLLFILSTLLFNLDGGGNRALVLLPFMVVLPALMLRNLFKNSRYKKVLQIILILGLLLQIVQSFAWVSIKLYEDPRQSSSKWILENIQKGSEIGIENIPIYQMLPDNVLKEYYFQEYNSNFKAQYTYKIISSKDKLPRYAIVTNDINNVNYITNSPKKELVNKLNKEGYRKIGVFSPNLKYYNIFADQMYFIIINIIQAPASISIYEK